MAFDRITSVSIRPDKITSFMEQVARLAEAARNAELAWRWTAHQTIFGEGMMLHFASAAESFAEIEEQGQVEALWLRALGAKDGPKAFEKANECVQAVQQTISTDRPDLSYLEGIGPPSEYPYAIVTAARARPGEAEGCEELIRKVAEAIPKTGDPVRLLAFQVVFGQMGSYWTVRPLRSLAELDGQMPTPELLNAAFGTAEGSLLWRTGSACIEEARREVLRLVPELSNPPAS